MHNMYDCDNVCNFRLEIEQFAAPGTHMTLRCKGRHCATCGKCRDWYYTGNWESWARIHDYKDWTDEDRAYWHNHNVWELFHRRNGATCIAKFGPVRGPDFWSKRTAATYAPSGDGFSFYCTVAANNYFDHFYRYHDFIFYAAGYCCVCADNIKTNHV